MMQTFNLFILFIAIFLNVATNASAKNTSDFMHHQVMYKRSYGWGLPLQFHNIAPGKISKYKREKRETEAAKQDVTAGAISSTSKTLKRNKKGKQTAADSFERKIHHSKLPSDNLNGESKNDSNASFASQSSSKKNNKKVKESASSYSVTQ